MGKASSFHTNQLLSVRKSIKHSGPRQLELLMKTIEQHHSMVTKKLERTAENDIEFFDLFETVKKEIQGKIDSERSQFGQSAYKDITVQDPQQAAEMKDLNPQYEKLYDQQVQQKVPTLCEHTPNALPDDSTSPVHTGTKQDASLLLAGALERTKDVVFPEVKQRRDVEADPIPKRYVSLDQTLQEQIDSLTKQLEETKNREILNTSNPGSNR